MPNTFEKAAEKVAGAAKVAKAEVKGLRGVFARLMQEHGEASALMKRIGSSQDVDTRRRLYSELRGELLSHERAETMVVYPILGSYPAIGPIASAHEREASELEAEIKTVDALDPADQLWGNAFDRLVKLVKHHVDEEESDYFPKALDAIGSERAKELEGQYQIARQTELTRLRA